MTTDPLTDSLREILALFDGSGAPRTTTEVADSVGVGRRTTYNRLDRLVELGRLETKKVGAHARVWWRPATAQSSSSAGGGSTARRVDAPDDQFELLIEAVEDYAISTLDPDGYVRTWNPGAERVEGHEAEEIVGEPVSTFYTDEDRAAGVPEEDLATAAEGGSVEAEGWRVRADGSRFWANVTITEIRGEDGVLDGFAKVTRDMTERREYERRLTAQAEQLQRGRDTLVQELDAVFERVDDAFYALDDEFQFEYVNDSAETYFDASERELLGRTFWEALEVEEDDPLVEQFETAMVTQEQTTFERYSDSLGIWMIVRVYPSETGLSVYVADITERKRAENELRESEERFRTMMERSPFSVQIFDADGRTIAVNPAWERLWDASREEATDYNILQDVQLEAAGLIPYIRDAFAGEVVTLPATYYDPAEIGKPGRDRWIEGYVYPLVPRDGGTFEVALVHHDVTERKERERELGRYEMAVETAWDGITILDSDDRFVLVNEAFCEITGYDHEEVVGEHATLILDESAYEQAGELYDEVVEGGHDTATLEYDLLTADGGSIPVEARFGPCEFADGTTGGTGIIRDVTDRVERERELEEARNRYRALVANFPNGAVALVDEDLRYSTVGGTPLEVSNATVDELEGRPLGEVLPANLADVLIPRYVDAFDGRESVFEEELGDEVFEFRVLPVRNDDGDVFAALGMSQDVTEQKARERELRNRVRQQEAVTVLGQRALVTRDLDELMAEAAEFVAETLDNDYCKVLDLDPDAEELLLRQGVGWDDGIVGTATVSAVEATSQAAYTLTSERPVRVEDLDTETRFSGPDLLTSHDVHSGISTIVGSFDDPWGILGTHDTEPKTFTEHDVRFVQSVANILASAIYRHDHERELDRQRAELASLNSLNEVFQDITDVVIEQSTREEIEAAVCEGLAGADSFSFAWIGEVGAATQTLDTRTEAGVEGYLADVTISVDPADERSQGPSGQAFLTREVQVARDIQTDESFAPWREQAESYGFQSSAGVPIVSDDRIYGVLGVYAERPDSFAAAERRILGQLGEIVGHAIAAVERKRALMSDEVIELEFYLEDAFAALGIDASDEGRITLDQAVPTSSGEYLVYGTATEEAWPALDGLVDVIPHWKAVSQFGAAWEGTHRFELRMDDPPVLSTVASRGGYVESVRAEDGDIQLVAHLPPTGDVRAVREAITDEYPAAELLAQRQLSRTGEAAARLERLVHEELTDRQRAALEAAFYSGFFEWPRDVTGEEVADSLGVSPPTFHQHLRKAEQKVLHSVLSAAAPS